jgi:hypothetical protein
VKTLIDGLTILPTSCLASAAAYWCFEYGRAPNIRIPGRSVALISCQHSGNRYPVLDVQPQSPDILEVEPQHAECTVPESEMRDVKPRSPPILSCSPECAGIDEVSSKCCDDVWVYVTDTSSLLVSSSIF